MRDFSDKSKFSVRSLPEIFESITVLVARYRARGFALGDQRWSREVLMNSVLVRFAGLPPADQDAFLRAGMEELGRMLDDGGGGEGGRQIPGGAGPGSRVDVVVKDVTEGGASRRRKEGG